jgi:hypothetical protein
MAVVLNSDLFSPSKERFVRNCSAVLYRNNITLPAYEPHVIPLLEMLSTPINLIILICSPGNFFHCLYKANAADSIRFCLAIRARPYLARLNCHLHAVTSGWIQFKTCSARYCSCCYLLLSSIHCNIRTAIRFHLLPVRRIFPFLCI